MNAPDENLSALDGLMDPVLGRAYDPATGAPITTYAEYTRAMFEAPRHVGSTLIGWDDRAVWVSTAHLVRDQSLGLAEREGREPELYETMIFRHSDHATWPPEVAALFEVQMRWRESDDPRARHDLVCATVVQLLTRLGHTAVTVRPDPETPLIVRADGGTPQ